MEYDPFLDCFTSHNATISCTIKQESSATPYYPIYAAGNGTMT
jgi:hypothetical protein